MSKSSRRQNQASRDNRRRTIEAKRATFEDDLDYDTWTQLSVGHTTWLSDTPRKKKRHPLGFRKENP